MNEFAFFFACSLIVTAFPPAVANPAALAGGFEALGTPAVEKAAGTGAESKPKESSARSSSKDARKADFFLFPSGRVGLALRLTGVGALTWDGAILAF